MTRKELYLHINKLNLQEVVKERFGDNYTRCSNKQLASVIPEAFRNKAVKTAPEVSPSTAPKCSSLIKLVEVLHRKKILLDSEVKAIMNA